MKEQNYANHRKLTPLFHIWLSLLLLVLLVGSAYNIHWQWTHRNACGYVSLVQSWLILGIVVFIGIAAFITRSFSATVQDRAIRAEENFRHFTATGKTLDKALTMKQIIALRFASDEEFVELAKRAVSENLTNDQIKRAIKNWRADHHRI